MENVKHGDTISRYTKVDGNVVHKHHVTRNNPTKSAYEMDWYFDFENVNHDELLELASRDLVIKHRPQFKSAPADTLEGWGNKTFSVREFLDRERRNTLSPEEKVRNAVAKMSPEQKAKLIAELSA